MSGLSAGAAGGGPGAGTVSPLVVEVAGSRLRLEPGPTYLVGRDPRCAVVVADVRVSRRHAVIGVEDGRWAVVDDGSANGIYVGDSRVGRVEITAECVVYLGNPATGPVLRLIPGGFERAVDEPEESTERIEPRLHRRDDAPLDIPYAVRWLVPNGERFTNFDVLNDNDTQLAYFRRFGHVYAVGVPAKRWRLVVVSDPELLERVATDEEQFGKRVEEINFFAQLRNSRGGGLSVIGDGEHYERVRRVMLPWYSPAHQRTQLELMKEQARKMVDAWDELPDDQPFEARGWMERYTLEVSGRGGCAYDFGLLDGTVLGTPSRRRFRPARRRASGVSPTPAPTRYCWPAAPAARAGRPTVGTTRSCSRTAGALVHARQHTCPAGQPIDLLSRLVSTPDPETGALLDAETVRDQVLMHLSNGFNGPSITAAWLVAVLATRPDVEAELIAEIDGITGGDPGYDLRYDDLASPDVHDPGDQGGAARLPADADHDPAQPQGRPAGPVPGPQGRRHPRRGARGAPGRAVLGPGSRPVRPGPLHAGADRRTAHPRLHPVLDRAAAVHGAGGLVHDAARRPVRDLPAAPSAPRAGCDGRQEHRGHDEAGGRLGDAHPARGHRGTHARTAVAEPRRDPVPARAHDRGEPTEIPATSPYRHW